MILRPPRSTRTDTLFPYTTPFRSRHQVDLVLRAAADVVLAQLRNGVRVMSAGVAGQRVGEGELVGIVVVLAAGALEPGVVGAEGQPRSAERRVGKECVSTCSVRRLPYN